MSNESVSKENPILARIIGSEIAEELVQETKEKPTQRKYIGMTCQSLEDRLKTHKHKDYSSKRIIREFDNLWLLRDVEFKTIRQYSAKVGSKYLRNIDAGGIYYNDVMEQKGILYVLNFDNEVDPDSNVKGPTRSFDNRDVQHYPKHVPKYTPLPSFDVPLFRDNFPSYSKALMIKFGYVLRKSSLEKSLEGSGLLKCVECAYSTDNSHNLAVHKNNAHNVINFECTLCGKTADC
ncbi:hypothetical protein PVAND_015369 [Polypedilum vanderplanki]|uniref:Uncharacterized protein n=1 Tax=Polypedilum vanderplanki TaxID=319348 RepID=A0A9J6BC25_POLVA|nr:hypothetical protein PVAND_015369 [Polypedilum vanderplanki]